MSECTASITDAHHDQKMDQLMPRVDKTGYQQRLNWLPRLGVSRTPYPGAWAGTLPERGFSLCFMRGPVKE